MSYIKKSIWDQSKHSSNWNNLGKKVSRKKFRQLCRKHEKNYFYDLFWEESNIYVSLSFNYC